MATADVAAAHKKWGVRCVVGDGKRAFWSSVFENNPKIAKTLEKDERFAWVPNFPMARPYIAEVTQERFIYRDDFRAVPGEIYLTEKEKRPFGQYIILEPNTKDKFTGPNKCWPWGRWQELVKLGYKFVQIGDKNARTLTGVKRIVTNNFRDALSVLSGAGLLVTTDGALHHAAAALRVPAIVIWGGAASPVNLGYESQLNLWHGAQPCGTHSKICEHCRKALDAVTVDEVRHAIRSFVTAAD